MAIVKMYQNPYSGKEIRQRNEIVAAYVWSIRHNWTAYMYNKYHRLTSADKAQATIKMVGDITKAFETTTSRDKNRLFYANRNCPIGFIPGSSGTMVDFYKAIMKGYMTMYKDLCKLHAPAVWRYAISKGIYPSHMA